MDVLRSPLPASAAGKGRRSSLTKQTGLLNAQGGALRVGRSSAAGEGLLAAASAAAAMKGVKVCVRLCVCVWRWLD